MSAYYNEIDTSCRRLLRELMRRGIIADGDIDDRSIADVQPTDLAGFSQCHWFAGIGTWSYALRMSGWPDDRPVWTGSCPCQPFSQAGKQRGFADARHLWPEFHRLIRERRPPVVLGEQVAGPAGRAWWDAVSADMEHAGYAVGAADLCAAGVGAPHIRQRLYWCAVAETGRVADPGEHGRQGRLQGRQNEEREIIDGQAGRDGATGRVAHAHGHGRGEGQRHHPPLGHGTPPAPDRGTDRPGPTNGYWRDVDWIGCRDGKWRPVKPGLVPLVDGTPERTALLRAIGNAIVPQVAAEFIETVMEVL